jgi:hypothetical protein
MAAAGLNGEVTLTLERQPSEIKSSRSDVQTTRSRLSVYRVPVRVGESGGGGEGGGGEGGGEGGGGGGGGAVKAARAAVAARAAAARVAARAVAAGAGAAAAGAAGGRACCWRGVRRGRRRVARRRAHEGALRRGTRSGSLALGGSRPSKTANRRRRRGAPSRFARDPRPCSPRMASTVRARSAGCSASSRQS